jgi:hypothetical protein
MFLEHTEVEPAHNCTCFYRRNGSCKMLPCLGHVKNDGGAAASRITLCVECWYTHKCNMINVYEKSVAFPSPLSMKFVNAQKLYVQTP